MGCQENCLKKESKETREVGKRTATICSVYIESGGRDHLHSVWSAELSHSPEHKWRHNLENASGLLKQQNFIPGKLEDKVLNLGMVYKRKKEEKKGEYARRRKCVCIFGSRLVRHDEFRVEE